MNFLICIGVVVTCILVLFRESHATGDQTRVRRGAAYAGALGSYTKLTPSVALGTFGRESYNKQTVQETLGSYGRFLDNPHGYNGKQTVQESLGSYGRFLDNPHGYNGKQTVQAALGAYGPFVEGGHRGPNVIGNEGSLFNKDH